MGTTYETPTTSSRVTFLRVLSAKDRQLQKNSSYQFKNSQCLAPYEDKAFLVGVFLLGEEIVQTLSLIFLLYILDYLCDGVTCREVQSTDKHLTESPHVFMSTGIGNC